MINFTGKLISSSTIPAIWKNGKPYNQQVGVYKLDPSSVQDNKILEKLVDIWAEEDTFVREIENNFKHNKYFNLGDSEEQFFILTRKIKGANGLHPDDVLAVAQTSIGKKNPNKIEIDYFQSIPKNIKMKETYSRNNIGKKLLDELKNIFYGKSLWLYSTHKAKRFYQKNGFHQIGKSEVGLPIMKF